MPFKMTGNEIPHLKSKLHNPNFQIQGPNMPKLQKPTSKIQKYPKSKFKKNKIQSPKSKFKNPNLQSTRPKIQNNKLPYLCRCFQISWRFQRLECYHATVCWQLVFKYRLSRTACKITSITMHSFRTWGSYLRNPRLQRGIPWAWPRTRWPRYTWTHKVCPCDLPVAPQRGMRSILLKGMGRNRLYAPASLLWSW